MSSDTTTATDNTAQPSPELRSETVSPPATNAPAIPAPFYLFTSFRGEGGGGLYLSLSRDGFRWTSLTQSRPFIGSDLLGTDLVRDPTIARGPDSVFHLVYTCGGGPSLGYACSNDLINWTNCQFLPVMERFPHTRNAWAPDLFWDELRGEFLLLWASTIEGRFAPEPREPGREGFDHRIFAVRTPDFQTFAPTFELFNPGHSATAPSLMPPVASGQPYRLVFKDDRWQPRQKCLRFAESAHPDGPYTFVSEPFTGEGCDGPSTLTLGEWTYIYFERAQPLGYGAMRTRDWKFFDDVSTRMVFPPGHRQGSPLEIDATVARKLLAQTGVTLPPAQKRD